MSREAGPCALLLALAQRAPGGDPALQRLGSRTHVEEHVTALRRAGIDHIAIVRHADDPPLPAEVGGVKVVLQPEREADSFDSLVLGLFALDASPVLVLPVRNEVLGEQTLSLLARRSVEGGPAPALVPRFGGRTGHPTVLLKTGIEQVVLDAVDPDGRHDLDPLLESWSTQLKTVDVDDDAVVTELDFPSLSPR